MRECHGPKFSEAQAERRLLAYDCSQLVGHALSIDSLLSYWSRASEMARSWRSVLLPRTATL